MDDGSRYGGSDDPFQTKDVAESDMRSFHDREKHCQENQSYRAGNRITALTNEQFIYHLIMSINFKKEARTQFRLMRMKFQHNATGAFIAGLALFCYGQTVLPGADTASKLMEKFSNEVALPDSKFLIFAMLSYCACLVLNGWPVAELIKKYASRPYLSFFFDICALASGASVAVLLTSATSQDIGPFVMTITLYVLALFLMATIIWTGIYLTSERFTRLSNAYLTPWQRHLPACAGFFMIMFYLLKYYRV